MTTPLDALAAAVRDAASYNAAAEAPPEAVVVVRREPGVPAAPPGAARATAGTADLRRLRRGRRGPARPSGYALHWPGSFQGSTFPNASRRSSTCLVSGERR